MQCDSDIIRILGKLFTILETLFHIEYFETVANHGFLQIIFDFQKRDGPLIILNYYITRKNSNPYL